MIAFSVRLRSLWWDSGQFGAGLHDAHILGALAIQRWAVQSAALDESIQGSRRHVFSVDVLAAPHGKAVYSQ